MRNILTFNEFINENSTPEYDEILDLYNEVGLEGMSKDEVDFITPENQGQLSFLDECDGVCGL